MATSEYGILQVSVITPEKTLFSAEAEMVTVPGTEGEFGVLPGHAPFISSLRPGVVVIDTADGKKRRIAVIGGFAEANPGRCTVIAEMALDCDQVSAADVQARLAEARAALELTADEQARSDAEKKLALAEAIEFILGETLLN